MKTELSALSWLSPFLPCCIRHSKQSAGEQPFQFVFTRSFQSARFHTMTDCPFMRGTELGNLCVLRESLWPGTASIVYGRSQSIQG